MPLAAYPPLPPAPDEHPRVAVMFALKVKPGGAGKAVGVEVRYRQDGKLFKQVFRQQVYACSVPSLTDEMDVFGEFEDEVKGISGWRAKS